MTPSGEKELLEQMEGAWRWDWPGGGSKEGMRNLLSHHKSMRAHPGSRRWGRDGGGEPLARGFKDWEGEEVSELDLPACIGRDVSILITSSPTWLLRVYHGGRFHPHHIVASLAAQGLSWDWFALL